MEAPAAGEQAGEAYDEVVACAIARWRCRSALRLRRRGEQAVARFQSRPPCSPWRGGARFTRACHPSCGIRRAPPATRPLALLGSLHVRCPEVELRLVVVVHATEEPKGLYRRAAAAGEGLVVVKLDKRLLAAAPAIRTNEGATILVALGYGSSHGAWQVA